MAINSQVAVGDVQVWDFGFTYNLHVMDLPELEVLMVKYEVELNRSGVSPRCLSGVEGEARYWEITDILGKIYREIMRRKLANKITEIENQELWKRKPITAQR